MADFFESGGDKWTDDEDQAQALIEKIAAKNAEDQNPEAASFDIDSVLTEDQMRTKKAWDDLSEQIAGYTGGGDGTGSTTTTVTTGGTTTDTGIVEDDGTAKYAGIGGDPELWLDTTTGTYYMVYYAPGDFETPIATLFSVPDEETLKAFGRGEVPEVDRSVTTEEIEAAGGLFWADTDALIESELDPWLGWKAMMDKGLLTDVALSDPVLWAMIGAAYLEGRALTPAERKLAPWYVDRNEAQEDWEIVLFTDPAEAEQRIERDRLAALNTFENIGAVGNDPELINWMAFKYTKGDWTLEQLGTQIEAVTSGWGEIDAELQAFLDSSGLSAVGTTDKSEEVSALFARWLGPAHPPSQSQIQQWSTQFRNDPSANEKLVAMLKKQRLALYPGYENPELTYEDIAAPWRSVVSRVLGITADEAGGLFQQIIRLNDLEEAEKLLRKHGISTGNSKVLADAAGSLFRSVGGSSVRSAL
jgi:hypothetical protein